MDYRDLPYDAEIEYLEGTGTQWIRTNYVPTGININVYTKITYNGYSNTSAYLPWYAAYTGEQQETYRIIRAGNAANKVWIYNGKKANGGGTEFSVSVGETYTISFEGNQYNINGITGTVSQTSSGSNTGVFTLFNSTTTNGLLKGRFYYFKVTKGGTTVLDLIPVRVGNVGYMYDRVSGQLFGNSGTGSFVLGPDVAPGRYANEIAFLESTGSQYIDLGVKANQDSVFELEFMATPRPEGQGVRVFGAREAWNQNAFAMTSKDATDMTPSFTYDNVNVTTDTFFPTINLDDGHWHTVKSNGQGHLQVDDVSKTVTFSNFTTPYNILLFGFNNGGTILGGCIKIRRVVLNNMQLIPVEYNNIGYLYDKVSGEFFANQGTGEFVLGHRAPRFDGKACARSYTRRQCLLNTENPPHGYEWANYIENTSSAYINTLLKGKQTLKVDTNWLFKKGEISGIMGASYNHKPYNALLYRANGNSTSYFYYGGSYGSASALTINKKWHIVIDSGELYYNNVLRRTIATAGDSTYNFMLFKVADLGTGVKGQLFDCKIYDNGILVRNYKPAKRLSDNKYGLWDKVEGKFYASASSANFVGG